MPKQSDMTQGRPLPLMVRFALPLMAGNALQLLYTVVDAAVVGRLIGLEAFASVGAAGFYYWLVLSVVMGLTQGFGTVLAQRFGARDDPGFRKTFGMAMVLTVAMGGVFSALGAGFATPVLALLRTPGDILPGAAAYLHMLLGGLIISFLYNMLGCAFRATGDSRTPLLALMMACGLNVALDIVLVRFTPLGISGVALATLLSQAASCAYCGLRLRGVALFRLERTDWRIDGATIRRLLALGAPMGARNCIIQLGGLAIQYVVNGYGTLTIAGIAAAKRLYGLVEIVGVGMEGATAVFVAQNYGATRMDRIRRGVRVALITELCSACVIMAALWFLGRDALGLLIGTDAQAQPVLDVAVSQLRVILIALPGLYLLCMYRAALQGIGNGWMPMLSGFLELAMRALAVFLLPPLLGKTGVYVAEIAGWPFAALQVVVAYVVCLRVRERHTFLERTH